MMSNSYAYNVAQEIQRLVVPIPEAISVCNLQLRRRYKHLGRVKTHTWSIRQLALSLSTPTYTWVFLTATTASTVQLTAMERHMRGKHRFRMPGRHPPHLPHTPNNHSKYSTSLTHSNPMGRLSLSATISLKNADSRQHPLARGHMLLLPHPTHSPMDNSRTLEGPPIHTCSMVPQPRPTAGHNYIR